MSSITIDSAAAAQPRSAEPVRVLITGGTGYLGSHLLHSLLTDQATLDRPLQLVYTYHKSKPLGIDASVDPVSAIQCDITSLEKVDALIDFIKPHVIVHTAAAGDTVWCEKNKSAANKINTDGTKNIITCIIKLYEQSNKQHQCALIHISSDWVYDGTESQYNQHMKTNGFGVYGKSKLAGENAIIDLCKKHGFRNYIILRSALIYGRPSPLNPEKQSALFSVMNAIQTDTDINLFSNEYRTPMYIDDLLLNIRYFINDFTESESPLSPKSPPSHRLSSAADAPQVYNCGGVTSCSRYEMGKTLAALLGVDQPKLRSITLEQANMVRARPKDLTMNSSKLRELTGLKTHTFHDGVIDMVRQLTNEFAFSSQRTPLHAVKPTAMPQRATA